MQNKNLFALMVVLTFLLTVNPSSSHAGTIININSMPEYITDADVDYRVGFPQIPGETKFQTDYVTQHWDKIVASLITVCRSSDMFKVLFSSFSSSGAAAGVGFEDGLITKALASYGSSARQVIGEYLKTLIKSYSTNGVFRDPVTGKMIKTEAELVSKLVSKSNLWRNVRMGSASITVVLCVATAFVAATLGYAAGKAYLGKLDLEVKASENAAFGNALALMAKAIQSGKLKLLPGVTQQTATEKIRENLEVGRAPFLNVFEARPCPDIAGTWTGQLFVKEVKGNSNIQEGSSRVANFTIDQDNCIVTLHFGSNQIKGEFRSAETLPSQVGGGKTERMEKDEAVLTDNAVGALSRARIFIYGLGSGSLQGKADIEIEQQSAGGTLIISGGMFTKK